MNISVLLTACPVVTVTLAFSIASVNNKRDRRRNYDKVAEYIYQINEKEAVCLLFKKTRENPELRLLSGKPVLRCSICTGEQTAGYISKDTGKFMDVMLIRNEADLDQFCNEYGVDRISLRKIY